MKPLAHRRMLRKPETFERGLALIEHQRGMSDLADVDNQLEAEASVRIPEFCPLSVRRRRQRSI